MDAVIFDFDGVVIDSEPLHLAAYRAVLAPLGIELSEGDYYARYLGLDDRDCFAAIFAVRGHGTAKMDSQIDALIAQKTQLVCQALRGVSAMPGACELIRQAAAVVPVGICSGGLRDEILQAVAALGIGSCIADIVSAEDVRHGKPDPQGYALSLDHLARHARRPLQPSRVIVVEDAPPGIAAARALGLCVLAVTNSYSASHLASAQHIVPTLRDVTLADLDAMTR